MYWRYLFLIAAAKGQELKGEDSVKKGNSSGLARSRLLPIVGNTFTFSMLPQSREKQQQ